MNEVRIKGNLAKDLELRNSAGGKPYCFATVAVHREYSKNADFVDVKIFGALATECANTLRKGNLVEVHGYLSKSKYEKDGQTYYPMSVVAEMVKLLPRINNETGGRLIIENDVASDDVDTEMNK